MTIGIIKENESENRVAMLPESVATLVKMNVSMLVETGAGIRAFASDKEYEESGATIKTKEQVIAASDLIIKIQPPTPDELALFKEGQVLMSVLNPYFNTALIKELADKNITGFSMDIVPRTSRAQAMDILSSMATIAGYKAVLTAANTLPKFFPMFMTAAGTIKPANMLILGAGVAGLQSIAIARKLGAVVYVFDVRAAVKEQVVGLGAKFVDVEGAVDDKAAGGYAVEQTDEFKARQAKAIHDQAVKSDVIICTAQIPGKQAPVLLRTATVEAMRPGSVIIDLAASTGGNCELTNDNQTIVHNGIKIIGNSQLPSDMPTDASRMFGKNLINFLKLIITKEGALNLNWEDDIVKGTAVSHDHQIVNDRVKSLMQ